MRGCVNKGFTLMEMAIVMVILSLVAGGITLASDLIQAAKLRATLTQIDQININYNNFLLKYGCLPGDCPDPAALGFPTSVRIKVAQNDETDSGVLPSLSPIASANAFSLIPLSIVMDSVVIAGNKNGMLDTPFEVLYGMVSVNKAFKFSTYSGINERLELPIDAGSMLVDDSTPTLSNIGVDIYTLPTPTAVGYSKAFWYVGYFTQAPHFLIQETGGSSGHYLFAASSAYNTLNGSARSTTPTNVYWIDSKIDDGDPLKGKVVATSDSTYHYQYGPSYSQALHTGPAGSPICINSTTLQYNLLPRVYENVCSFLVKSTF